MANLWLSYFAMQSLSLSPQDYLDFAAEAQIQLCAGLSLRGGVVLPHSPVAHSVMDRWKGKRPREQALADAESQLKEGPEFVAKLKNETKESPFSPIN
jgi:hypothetical protein